MKQTPRTRKLNEQVREAIASILLDEIADPRLELVTVTAVHVAPDLMQANVYVTAHGDDERYREVLAGLESAKGRMRTLVGQRIKGRFTPELRFFIDDSIDNGMRIGEALKEVPPTMLAASEADTPTEPEASSTEPDSED